MKVKLSISDWLGERLRLEDLPKTPRYMYRVSYWTGALVAAAFMLTVITGLLLLLYYNPSSPYDQTTYLIAQVPYGAVLLYTHLYAAYAMIFLIFIHMYRNYMSGAYKKPRELLWVIGLVMLAAVLATAFVGYSLVGDVLSVNAVDVAKGMIAVAPGGAQLSNVIFGNGTQISLFTRMLGWHVALVALVAMLFGFHFFLAERYGIMPSMRSKPRAPATYTKDESRGFQPWWPRNFVYMASVVLMTWGLLFALPNAMALINNLPSVISPMPAPSPTSPQAVNITPYPPWFFLFFYKIADFQNLGGAPYTPLEVIAVAAMIPLAYLVLLPFLDRSRELNPFSKQRRLFTWLFASMIIILVELSVWGFLAPGIPVSFTTQVALLLPPVAICGTAVFLIESGSTRRSIVTRPRGIISLLVLAMLLTGTLGGMIQYPTVYTVGVVLSVMFVLLAYVRRSGVPPADGYGEDQSGGNRRANRVRLAEWLAAALLILSFAVAAALWEIPSTGALEPYFGVGLGAVFLMLGEVISLYHYVSMHSYGRDGIRN